MTLAERVTMLTDALAAEILRRQQAEAENIAMRAHLAITGTAAEMVVENAALRVQVADLTEKLEIMTYRMVQMTRRVFGRSSETHHPDQQHLDEIMRQILVENELRPDDSTAATTTAATTADATTTSSTAATATLRTKRRGRLSLPDTLPIEERFIELPESERLGPDGKPLPQIGTRIVDKLDHFPAWFRRLRLIYAIYGSSLPQVRISANPMPCIVPKGLPTDTTVAMVLVEKYDYHCPLYRQETKLERAGIDLGRSTLMNWVRHGATALLPIQAAIGASIREHPVIGMDDTWIRTLVTAQKRVALFPGNLLLMELPPVKS
ncbi:MAG: transposase [Sphingosinicella sp.]|nr:transposase [Sphingosinicella sp.]